MSPTQQAKTWQDFVRDAKSRIQEIPQDELRRWMSENKDMVILDVREPNDHALSRIEGAMNIPRGVVELEIEETVPDKNTTIVAYCGGGGRSAMVADVLQEMGYTDVYSLQGGYKQWKEKPYPSTDY